MQMPEVLRLLMLYVKSLLLVLCLLLNAGFAASTSNIEKCLDNEPNETQACLAKSVKHVSLNNCYEQVSTIRSNYLKENLLLYCFYHISEFPNLNTCVSKARQFSDAENHDAALFNCYSQFESVIKKPACETMSKLFKIPEKGRYLKSNCENLD